MQKRLLKISAMAVNDLPGLRRAIAKLMEDTSKAHKAKNKAIVAKLSGKSSLTEKQREKLAKSQAQLSPNHKFHLGAWYVEGLKMLAFLDDGVPRFTVFMEGNSKLPFYAFSALPIITCPGFGDCGKWCYSFKAWRYPAAFFRQLQNTVLILHDKETLAKEFDKLPQGVVLRIYVDGDIDSMPTLDFWQDQLKMRPDLIGYGYSKSWPLFLSYAKAKKFAANYKLNLSGGSRYNGEYLTAMKKLDCVRGEFVAFKVATKQKKNAKQYAREVKQAAKQAGHEKVFVCPGQCGECVRGGVHACGSDKFNGVSVAIGIH